jgi:hypothetical protein
MAGFNTDRAEDEANIGCHSTISISCYTSHGYYADMSPQDELTLLESACRPEGRS